MRIALQLKIEKLPIQYRMICLAFVKEMIRQGDEEMYNHLYDNIKKPKQLTYSIYMRNFKASQTHYEMEGATFIFSSSDPMIALAFINGVSTTKKFEHQNVSIEIEHIQIVQEAIIREQQAEFAILNALLVEDVHGKPVLIDDENFETELNHIMNAKFQYLYGRTLKQPLKIVKYRLKKVVVKETNRHANGKTLYYTGQKGRIVLKGHPEDLQNLYYDGIGLRTSSGWGTLEFIK